jgi:hypothetical protein
VGLTIKPTSLQIHTSVAGVGGLLGEVIETFELVLALGTKECDSDTMWVRFTFPSWE